MKTIFCKRFSILPAALLMLLSALSCDELFESPDVEFGDLHIMFAEDFEPQTRSATVPDVNDFILTVSDQNGGTVYNGKFGAAPESFAVSPGAYTVTAVSREFNDPMFDAPQYGDTQVAVVDPGQSTDVQLVCSQQNAGVKLKISQDFLKMYPDGVFFLKSPGGKLMYSYSESRTAYFKPGSISLVLSDKDNDKVLMTRSLSSSQMLVVNITASSPSKTGAPASVSVSVDTARQWLNEDYDLGGNGGGADISSSYSVTQARNHIGAKNVWICGYIVGGDLSAKNCSFTPPFTSKTNLVLSSKQNCTDRNVCLSVQLAKGDVRDALNLVDHEESLGRKVYVRGNIVESYYGLPGIQEITEYAFE